MKLVDLLSGLSEARIVGDSAVDIKEVRDDSRAVEKGDLFVAVPGTATDGRRFLSEARRRGAAALVVESGPRPAGGGAGEGEGAPGPFDGTLVVVPSARRALASIAANRFGSARPQLLSAVTGTNGKTTTTYLLESILAAAGVPAGVVGTITYRLATGPRGDAPDGRSGFSRAAPLTTPGALALHALFAEMHAAGARDVILEASSHALDQGRLDGCRFRVAGLTNLTQDHLDYHRTMASYLDAKAILFERLLEPVHGVAVLPVDLPEGRAMQARVRAAGGTRTSLTVAATAGWRDADVVVESASLSAAGLRARLATPVGPLAVVSPLVGDYNLANIVLAVGMAIARGLAADEIAAGIERLRGVPGRLERVDNSRGVLCVVDYAHTPDALERSQAVLRPLVAAGGRLLTVFGCGGDRDQSKRPLMGEAAAAGSDLTIVTSDNPRGEDPVKIVDMIVVGVRGRGIPELLTAADLARFSSAGSGAGYHVQLDRRQAIQAGVSVARPGDVLLIAGKGHEDYQLIGGQRIHFDDREEAATAFATPRAGEVPA